MKKYFLSALIVFILQGCASNSSMTVRDSNDWSVNEYVQSTEDSEFLWSPIRKTYWSKNNAASVELSLSGKIPGYIVKNHKYFMSRFEARERFYWKVPLPVGWKIFNISLHHRGNSGCSSASSTSYMAKSYLNTSIIGNSGFTTGSTLITPNTHTATYCDYGNKPSENNMNDYFMLSAAHETLRRGGKYFHITKIKKAPSYHFSGVHDWYSVNVLYNMNGNMNDMVDLLNPRSKHWEKYNDYKSRSFSGNEDTYLYQKNSREVIPVELNLKVNKSISPFVINITKPLSTYFTHPKREVPTFVLDEDEKEWGDSSEYKELHHRKYYYYHPPKQYDALKVKNHMLNKYSIIDRIDISPKIDNQKIEQETKGNELNSRMIKFER